MDKTGLISLKDPKQEAKFEPYYEGEQKEEKP